MLMRKTTRSSEFSYISASGAIGIFIFAPYFHISAAIAALTGGIVVKNPRFIFLEKKYQEEVLLNFWEDLIYIIEIFAFVSIGILFQFENFKTYWMIGLILTIIVIVSRILSVFTWTLPLEVTPWTKEMLSNKERIFIAIAGFRGLTTAVLALIAYVSLVDVEGLETFANLILYSSLSLILISGVTQGLLLPYVSRKTQVVMPNK